MATLRALRPVPDPLGSYFRPGRRDGKFMLQMMVEGKFKGSGLVVDPCLRARQSDLVQEGLRQKIEVVLDPRSVELSTPGGFSRSGVSDLAWASRDLHRPSDWTGAAGLTAVNHLVDAVENEGYSAVLAPTHVLDGPDSPWWSVDLIAVHQLRDALDAHGLGKVLIYHPLVTRASALLRNPSWRLRIIEDLGSAPIDALWLRVHPFGTATSGPLALRRYLELCRELHGLKVPLVAERSGTVGVALLAFGAVGGIESGVTIGERVDLDPYLRPPDPNGNGFSPPPRAYLHELGAFLDPKRAEALFGHRGMKAAHGCRDTECCPRGWRDVSLEPRRHFITARTREVTALSQMPEALRPGQYMENFLRPASDAALRAAELEPSLLSVRKRLDSWRGTLGADLAQPSHFNTVSAPAAGKRLGRTA